MTDAAESDFVKLLEDVPTRPMRRRLVRCVAALDFLCGGVVVLRGIMDAS